jgi:hypothetical protein
LCRRFRNRGGCPASSARASLLERYLRLTEVIALVVLSFRQYFRRHRQ